MKTRTWIALLSALLILCLGLSLILLRPQASSFAEVSSDGQVVRTVDLRIDQTFAVTTADGGSNTVTVKDGKIAVTQATCPDHYCMDRGYCSGGLQIVCLPNRLIIRFLGNQMVDAVVG